jgi:N-acetylglucosamine kinase-like BadF-type ATPase
MRAVAFEWLKRGPKTILTKFFLGHFGARNMDDLIEGVYMQRYPFEPALVLLVFEAARQGDPEAMGVMRWAGDELGQMAVGVINQLKLQDERFEVVLIGSLHDGSKVLSQALRETVLQTAPGAQFVRLTVPPVVGGVLLGMEDAGLKGYSMRDKLITTTKKLLKKD